MEPKSELLCECAFRTTRELEKPLNVHLTKQNLRYGYYIILCCLTSYYNILYYNILYTVYGIQPKPLNKRVDISHTREDNSKAIAAMKALQANIRLYGCKSCDFKSNSSGGLTRHALTQTDRRSVKCAASGQHSPTYGRHFVYLVYT